MSGALYRWGFGGKCPRRITPIVNDFWFFATVELDVPV